MPRKPVSHYIKLLFPYGTRLVSAATEMPAEPNWAEMPEWPPDVFAAAAYLVDTSGAYQYLQYNPNTHKNGDPFAVYGTNRRRLEILGAAWAFQLFDDGGWDTDRRRKEAEAAVRVFGGSITSLTPNELLKCQKQELQELWTKLVNAHDEPLVLRQDELPEVSGTPPGWWRHAMQLLIVADQASRGIGFCPGPGGKKSSWTQWQHYELVAKDAELKGANGSHASMRITTLLSPMVDRNLVNVLPKCRTPSVGWTLRSLTHHLAFIPPQGKLGTVWHMSVSQPPPAANRPEGGGNGKEVGRALNLLIVPFPYTIRAECFKPKGELKDKQHAEFAVDPLWLTDDAGKGGVKPHKLSSFIEELCEVARHEDQYVNGIILPEQALDQATFYRIANSLADHEHLGKEFEFIMSGLHRIRTPDGKDLSGVNYVGVRGKLFRDRDPKQADETEKPWHWDGKWDYKAYRGKHHRWKLDARQISRYGLTHRLGADKQAWWEGIGIRQRVIDIFTPRHGSTMTALICEDLARNDPCLDVIRAIGPNLVVALLMDGPQTSYRWPAHYAGVLAEDPGSSVLTVTNFGMVARSSVRDSTRSRSVAFWKDSVGNQLELQLPEGFHALLLSLRGVASEEKTLDGRRDGGSTFRWELASVMPLRASRGLSD